MRRQKNEQKAYKYHQIEMIQIAGLFQQIGISKEKEKQTGRNAIEKTDGNKKS